MLNNNKTAADNDRATLAGITQQQSISIRPFQFHHIKHLIVNKKSIKGPYGNMSVPRNLLILVLRDLVNIVNEVRGHWITMDALRQEVVLHQQKVQQMILNENLLLHLDAHSQSPTPLIFLNFVFLSNRNILCRIIFYDL